jgi:nucleoside-diphosphate-sugar epimerase
MDSTTAGPALDSLRIRRAELREAMNTLEAALAAPATNRAVVWGERVHTAVVALAADFDEHIVVTEGPNGLHQSILAGDLRLANAVDALTAEHAVIAGEIAALLQGTEPPVVPDYVDDIRDRGTHLLSIAVRHRQRGADLIYEAYDTDIGGGD